MVLFRPKGKKKEETSLDEYRRSLISDLQTGAWTTTYDTTKTGFLGYSIQVAGLKEAIGDILPISLIQAIDQILYKTNTTAISCSGQTLKTNNLRVESALTISLIYCSISCLLI